MLGARLAGKPCIATAHGTYTIQPLLHARHAKRARWTYARFSGLISVSGYTARRLREVLGKEADLLKVRTIPNCVDLAPLEEPQNLEGCLWSDKRFTLGIGETKERKGHHLALGAWVKAAADQPDLHHFTVGRLSNDDYEASLRAIAREGGMQDRVHFLGNVTEAEKIDLTQRCEAFVHTPVTASDGGFEGFGIVYLEASACGKPVLGTNGCGAEDAIVHDETGLLADPDPDSVTAALTRLLGDPELRPRMGEAGRRHARANTWEKNAAAVLELYDSSLGGRA